MVIGRLDPATGTDTTRGAVTKAPRSASQAAAAPNWGSRNGAIGSVGSITHQIVSHLVSNQLANQPQVKPDALGGRLSCQIQPRIGDFIALTAGSSVKDTGAWK